MTSKSSLKMKILSQILFPNSSTSLILSVCFVNKSSNESVCLYYIIANPKSNLSTENNLIEIYNFDLYKNKAPHYLSDNETLKII